MSGKIGTILLNQPLRLLKHCANRGSGSERDSPLFHFAASRNERRVVRISEESGIEGLKGLIESGLCDRFFALSESASDHIGPLQRFLDLAQQVRHLRLILKFTV